MAPKKQALLLLLAMACFPAAAAAAPARLAPTFRTAETLAGSVDMHIEGGAVLVSLGAANRVFRVELDGNGVPPISLRADAAQILYWKGHLVVIAPAEGKAFHFSVAGFAPPSKLSEDRQQSSARPDASALKLDPRGLTPWNLDEALSSGYELTRIATASSILSREGPALRPKDDYQDYTGGGGGGGGCATSCSVTCVGGTSCSATCSGTAGSCAHCSCPASCSCS